MTSEELRELAADEERERARFAESAADERIRLCDPRYALKCERDAAHHARLALALEDAARLRERVEAVAEWCESFLPSDPKERARSRGFGGAMDLVVVRIRAALGEDGE